MTPILILLFGFQPTMTIGTHVTYAAVTKMCGSRKHWRQGSVDVLPAVFLILFYPPTTDCLVGTDVFHAMILLLLTGLAQIGVGDVDLRMVATLPMGSIPGMLIGSHLT